MALARTRRSTYSPNYWPGFVDALSTLLLAIMFLLSVFVLAQFLLGREITGKDEALNRLHSQIDELSSLLTLERASRKDVEDSLTTMKASLIDVETEKGRLQKLLDEGKKITITAEGKVSGLSNKLTEERQLSKRARSQVEFLNLQISALRRQIAALENALEVSEKKDQESRTKIADLGKRLNIALAQKVQELNRYRSDFFGRLREILGARSDIRIVGDRFIFQSEVLFSSGSGELNPAGKLEMLKVAHALITIGKEIPGDINWVLRVDGHTDNVPLLGTGLFKDNWELSSARAISVVRNLIEQGVPANRLVAAGFGEFQPLEDSDTPETRSRNRRIELKLTQR